MKPLMIVLLCLCCTPTFLTAESVPVLEGIPDSLEPFITDVAKKCGSRDVAVLDPQGFQRSVDFNGDGTPDYFVSSLWFRCQPEGSLVFEGSAGNHYWVFVSQPDGSFIEKLHTSGHAVQFEYPLGENTVPTLVFNHHGSLCGLHGFNACVGEVSWDDREQEFVESNRN